ncbi:helix-turn-helix domain-containing protein [Mahella australiensis]|uniref:Cytoskeleton protein RodZ-like C-terminal domain-containing protein n=1 Tax=Mahella australiensis (strain DSM 15567 / CIP 107919 / 50-1 BON) TaxID=697281 RepID=F3ZYX9_MAHA5|nr:helix-turn-helix domain-containing protein [Mahella australiensis]AEE96738.1 hypothetical protein Mahau_1549 [Mahella australiensis 50-1 BON]
MDEIGEILKQARINKNMTIQDVHEITKIMPRYLRAIEEGQWDLLPGTVYTRGYIRSYAEAVGVDGDYLIRQFDRLLRERADNSTDREEQHLDSKTDTTLLEDTSDSAGTGWWLVALIGIVAITIIFYFVFVWQPDTGQSPDTSQPPVVDQTPEPQSESESAPQSEPQPEPEPEQPPQAQLTLLEQKANSAVYTIVTDKERFSVTVSATGRCWVRITADGKRVWEGTLEAGGTHTADAANKLTVRLGFPPGADVKVEDQVLPHVDSKNPYEFTIQR